MPFQVDYIPLSSSAITSLFGIWSGNAVFQILRPSGEACQAHDFHNVGRCDCSSIWESFKKSADSKPMVSMTVCNVDGCQVLTFCCNPICQSIGLLDRHRGIHQDGVPHAINEG